MIFFFIILGFYVLLGAIAGYLLADCLGPPKEIIFSMSPAEVQRRYHDILTAKLREMMTWRSPWVGLVSTAEEKESNDEHPR